MKRIDQLKMWAKQGAMDKLFCLLKHVAYQADQIRWGKRVKWNGVRDGLQDVDFVVRLGIQGGGAEGAQVLIFDELVV